MPYLQYTLTLKPLTAQPGMPPVFIPIPETVAPQYRRNIIELCYLTHIPESARITYAFNFDPANAPVSKSLPFSGRTPIDYSERRLIIVAHGRQIVADSDIQLDRFNLESINTIQEDSMPLSRLIFFGLSGHTLALDPAIMASSLMYGSWFYYETVTSQKTPIQNYTLKADDLSPFRNPEPATARWIGWAPFQDMQNTTVIKTLKSLVTAPEILSIPTIGKNLLYNVESLETDIIAVIRGELDLFSLLKSLREFNLLYHSIALLSCRNPSEAVFPEPLRFILTPEVIRRRREEDPNFINQLKARRDGFRAIWEGSQVELRRIDANLRSNAASLSIAPEGTLFRDELLARNAKLIAEREKILQIKNLLDDAEREFAFYTQI